MRRCRKLIANFAKTEVLFGPKAKKKVISVLHSKNNNNNNKLKIYPKKENRNYNIRRQKNNNHNYFGVPEQELPFFSGVPTVLLGFSSLFSDNSGHLTRLKKLCLFFRGQKTPYKIKILCFIGQKTPHKIKIPHFIGQKTPHKITMCYNRGEKRST